VSRDKDLMQLVCPTVRLYDPVSQQMIGTSLRVKS